MKRSIIILVALFMFYSCDVFKLENTSTQEEIIKPKIKSCKIYSYNLNKDQDLEEGVLIEEFEYNENGLETKLVRYDTAGNVICNFSYKYDKYGNLTEKIWSEAREQNLNDGERVDLSFEKLKEVEMLTTSDTGKSVYDKSGNLVERVWNDPGSESGIKETHHYYEDGREVEIKFFNELNELERKTIHSYDSYGNEIALITYNKEGDVIDKLTYSYDEYGNIKEDIYWNLELDQPEQIIKYIYEFY